VALPPLIIILITYGSNTTLPFRIPGALGALMLGGCLFGLQVCVAYAHVYKYKCIFLIYTAVHIFRFICWKEYECFVIFVYFCVLISLSIYLYVYMSGVLESDHWFRPHTQGNAHCSHGNFHQLSFIALATLVQCNALSLSPLVLTLYLCIVQNNCNQFHSLLNCSVCLYIYIYAYASLFTHGCKHFYATGLGFWKRYTLLIYHIMCLCREREIHSIVKR
jgi:hypothetical protein